MERFGYRYSELMNEDDELFRMMLEEAAEIEEVRDA
jgi:hypothetical protein